MWFQLPQQNKCKVRPQRTNLNQIYTRRKWQKIGLKTVIKLEMAKGDLLAKCNIQMQ